MHLVLIIGIVITVADRPASGHLIRLIEPAVEDAEIRYAVQRRFHAAGAAGRLAAARSVQPHIDTLHQLASDLDSVVLEKNDAAGKLRIARELKNLANECLPRMVSGVRLARKNDLNRHPL